MAKSTPSAPSPVTAPTPVVEPVVAPVFAAPVEAPAPAAEPKIEVISESLALITAEPVPGVRRYINGLADDGRVLACDTREAAVPMNPNRAKAIIKDVRKVFPNAEITLVLV